MAKAILFLPQFVVVYAFPSLSKEATSRRTLLLALAMSAGLGLIGVLATLVLPDLALLFVGGDDFEAIADDIWKFAIVGTLLAMIQLLVYSALARRQGRAVILIWTSLAAARGRRPGGQRGHLAGARRGGDRRRPVPGPARCRPHWGSAAGGAGELVRGVVPAAPGAD